MGRSQRSHFGLTRTTEKRQFFSEPGSCGRASRPAANSTKLRL